MKRTAIKVTTALLAITMVLSLLSGCGQTAAGGGDSADSNAAYLSATAYKNTNLAGEAKLLSSTPAVAKNLTTEASGKKVQKTDRAEIDYSNTSDGYVMVRFTANTQKRLKARVTGPSNTVYTYNLPSGTKDWTTFPLSDGNGSYQVTVYENASGTTYYTVASVSFSVKLADEFAPFLRPNQYVDYSDATNTVAKAAELTKGMTDPLDKVKAVYEFVVKTLSYDRQKANTVQSGYLPVLDTVLASKKGICFDYASLMTAMLRSQGVPCKLVVGYAGESYHAWINVWSKEKGWISAAVYFDGTTWKRLDPTFASSGKQSVVIMKYINDDSNYSAKYLY